MKLIKNLSLLGLSIFGLTVNAAEKAPASKWSMFHELAGSWSKLNAGKDDPHFSSVLYSAVGYKIDANNDLGVETRNGIKYTGNAPIEHLYLRAYLDQKNTFTLKGWTTGLRWRWYVPTNAGTHTAGGWGKFGIRPQISRTWGQFSVLALDLIQVHLTNQSFQKYTANRAPAKGVDLFVNALEVIPNYNFTKILSLSWDATLATIYTGHSAGTDGAFATTFGHELALGLDTKAMSKEALDYVAVSVTHESPMKNFKFYSQANEYNLKIGRTF